MSSTANASFHWDDPLLIEKQLDDDERQVRDAAHAYCQERLAPRVLDAFRHETADPAIAAVSAPCRWLFVDRVSASESSRCPG